MFVRTDARRQGIGAALVEAVAVWASARGHTRLELGVADANDEAERLYACCGFVRTGAVARHPVGNVAREVRMALEL
jgi:GNAT superfamily N-acetyltransferase